MAKSTNSPRHRKSVRSRKPDFPSPKEIVTHLDQVVVGQYAAKKRLAVGVSNHYKWVAANQNSDSLDPGSDLADVRIEKSNILLIGPTGSGKTILAKSLAEKLDVPFAIGDATTLTQTGYVGDDVETLLQSLLMAADGDIEKAQRGIIYIDEIDKLRKTSDNVSITRDVSGEGVQQALLKLIEGTVSNVLETGSRKHPEAEMIQIDTTNILFICGGAFVGLDRMVAKRVGPSAHFKQGDYLNQVTSHDLVRFGMIPELVGRLPVTVGLNDLGLEDLMSILTEPRNALFKQYRKLCSFNDIDLDFTDDATLEIAKRALAMGTGARGLRSVLDSVMTDVFYELSDEGPATYRIDAAVVRGKSGPTKVAA